MTTNRCARHCKSDDYLQYLSKVQKAITINADEDPDTARNFAYTTAQLCNEVSDITIQMTAASMARTMFMAMDGCDNSLNKLVEFLSIDEIKQASAILLLTNTTKSDDFSLDVEENLIELIFLHILLLTGKLTQKTAYLISKAETFKAADECTTAPTRYLVADVDY